MMTLNEMIDEARNMGGQPQIHICGLNCVATGCAEGKIAPPVARAFPGAADRKCGSRGPKYGRTCTGSDTHRGPCADGISEAWANPARNDSFADQLREEGLTTVAYDQWLNHMRGVIEANLAEASKLRLLLDSGKKSPPGIFQYSGAAPVAMAESDYRGRDARLTNPEVTAGCRLGCACPQHAPVRPEPWRPSVDDWDLLPDA